jgi:hypothetical protein
MNLPRTESCISTSTATTKLVGATFPLTYGQALTLGLAALSVLVILPPVILLSGPPAKRPRPAPVAETPDATQTDVTSAVVKTETPDLNRVAAQEPANDTNAIKAAAMPAVPQEQPGDKLVVPDAGSANPTLVVPAPPAKLTLPELANASLESQTKMLPTSEEVVRNVMLIYQGGPTAFVVPVPTGTIPVYLPLDTGSGRITLVVPGLNSGQHLAMLTKNNAKDTLVLPFEHQGKQSLTVADAGGKKTGLIPLDHVGKKSSLIPHDDNIKKETLIPGQNVGKHHLTIPDIGKQNLTIPDTKVTKQTVTITDQNGKKLTLTIPHNGGGLVPRDEVGKKETFIPGQNVGKQHLTIPDTKLTKENLTIPDQKTGKQQLTIPDHSSGKQQLTMTNNSGGKQSFNIPNQGGKQNITVTKNNGGQQYTNNCHKGGQTTALTSQRGGQFTALNKGGQPSYFTIPKQNFGQQNFGSAGFG